jgi:hypothetical protein
VTDTVEVLNLNHNGCEAHAEALKVNNEVATLALKGNCLPDNHGICDAGCEALAKALKKNDTIEFVDL